MLSIFHKSCCRCHEQNTDTLIEFDTVHDPNVPGYVGADGTIGSIRPGSPVKEHTILSKGGIEADDTDSHAIHTDKRMTNEDTELSKAWKEAEAMRNISYKLQHYDVDQSLAHQRPVQHGAAQETKKAQTNQGALDANKDGILTYDEFHKGAYNVTQQGKHNAYESNPNLMNIQAELERTRALLGLPPRKLEKEPEVPSLGQRPPAGIGTVTTHPFDRSLPNFGGQQQLQQAQTGEAFPPHSGRYQSSEGSEPMSSERGTHRDAPGGSREEQKQKIRDEVAALRNRVRKAKNDILANQNGVGGNLRASPRNGMGMEHPPRWGMLDPSPREESRATREESRATTGTFVSADVSTF
jgi:hypothetical protein